MKKQNYPLIKSSTFAASFQGIADHTLLSSLYNDSGLNISAFK